MVEQAVYAHSFLLWFQEDCCLCIPPVGGGEIDRAANMSEGLSVVLRFWR